MGLAALLSNVLGPAAHKLTENLDPQERQKKDLESKEIQYKKSLLDRQITGLNSGGAVDSRGVPLEIAYDPIKSQDFLYKKAATEHMLRPPAPRAGEVDPNAPTRYDLSLPNDDSSSSGIDLPPEGSDRPKPTQFPATGFLDNVNFDLSTGVPQMHLPEPKAMPDLAAMAQGGAPLLADNSMPNVSSPTADDEGQVMSTDNPQPASDENADQEAAAPPAAPADQGGKIQSIALPAPGPRDVGRPVAKMPDGSWRTDRGYFYFPDTGHIEADLHGVRVGWAKPGVKSGYQIKEDAEDKPKPHRTQMVQINDPETGQPKSVLYDMDPSTPNDKRVIDDTLGATTRQAAQMENVRLRMVNSAKTQPAIIGYINVRNAYESLAENAKIPAKDRTAQDDMMALQSFGAIEHPSSSITDTDKKMVTGGLGWKDWLALQYHNIRGNKANLLDEKAVHAMATAAKRALDGRQTTYNQQLAPLIEEAKRLNMTPAQINGALGANLVGEPPDKHESKSAKLTPEQAIEMAQQRLRDIPADTTDPVLQKQRAVAQKVIDQYQQHAAEGE